MEIQDIYKKETGKSPSFFSGIGQKLFSNDYIKWLEVRASSKGGKLTECDIVSLDFEDDLVQVKPPSHIMNNGFHAGSVLIDFSGVQD